MFLDLFGCNMWGIVLGAMTIKYMGVSRINWIYKKPSQSEDVTAKCDSNGLVRAFSKLKPDLLTTYDWEMLSSLKRYMWVWFYIFFILSVDAMNFFVKYVVWVGAESDLLKARVAIWGFVGIVTSKEYFEYMDDPNCKRVGPFFWLSSYTLMIEYGIWFKFSRGLTDAPFPWYVKVIFVTYAAVVLLGGLIAYNNDLKNNAAQKSKTNKAKYNLLDPEVEVEDTKQVLSAQNKKHK